MTKARFLVARDITNFSGVIPETMAQETTVFAAALSLWNKVPQTLRSEEKDDLGGKLFMSPCSSSSF